MYLTKHIFTIILLLHMDSGYCENDQIILDQRKLIYIYVNNNNYL